MSAKKIYLIFLFTCLTKCIFGQTVPKYIIFYKPYTDSCETNLYKDTLVKFNYKIQYDNLKNANIKEDVENAIRNNDLRIIAISGNSYLYPGLEGGYKELRNGTKAFIGLSKKYEVHFKKYGFKVIKGTSDYIDLSEVDLQSAAYGYAQKYNKLLFIKVANTENNKH